MLAAYLACERGTLDSQGLNESFAKLTFGKKARLRIYRQLQKLHDNGVQLNKALEVIWNRASKNGKKPTHPEAVIVDAWRREYQKAASLSAAVSGWVPARDRMIIEAGELGGEIGKALGDVIDVSEGASRMKGALVGSLAYPMILLGMLIGVMWLFGTQVIPPFAQILDPESWTGMAGTMATMSELVQVWTLPALAAIAAVAGVFAWSLPRWTGGLRARLDRFAPWSIYRLFQGVGFMLSLSALLRAGVHLPVALKRLQQTANPWLDERISAARHYVNAGRNLGDALQEAGHGFPDDEIIADLRVYADLARLEDAIEQIAREWIEEGIGRVKMAARSINALMLFAFAGTIAWLYYGLFQLYQLIQAAASV